MKIYFNLTDNYLNGWSSSDEGNEYHAEVEDDHEVLRNPEIFRFEDGELIKDDERRKELKEENSKLTTEEMNEMAILELATLVSEMKGGN